MTTSTTTAVKCKPRPKPLTITRERIYSPSCGKSFLYRARLLGRDIRTGDTAELCAERAYKTLAVAHEYVDSTCHARVANDGTLIIVRRVAEDIVQSEYNRNGRSSGISIGKMTDGYKTLTGPGRVRESMRITCCFNTRECLP
jgi:hypothetical protein